MAISGGDDKSRIASAMENADRSNERQERQEREYTGQRGRSDYRDDRRGDDTRGSERWMSGGRYAGLADIGRANATPLPMTSTGHALEQFRRDFAEAMPEKDGSQKLDVQIFPIDAATADLPFSMLVVAGVKRGAEALGAAHHTFILAGSADPLLPRTESFRGQTYQIVMTPGDAYTPRTREVVRDVLMDYYKDKPLISADAEVIYAGFPTAKENPDAIADCVKNSLAAINVAITRNDPQGVQLQIRAEDSGYNTIHVQHRQNHLLDRGGLPMRADAIIDLVSRDHDPNRNRRDPIAELTSGRRISRLAGYYDLVYAPADGALTSETSTLHRRRNTTNEEYQYYALRWITTAIDTVDFSPNSILLALATANAMGESSEILRYFEPNRALGEDDIRNIGALAIETNLADNESGVGDREPTKSEKFSPQRRQALLRTTLRPGVIQSFDVPECGASTWQFINWLAVADGSTVDMDKIYDAACVLTAGYFEDEYRRGDPIVDDHIERIVNGFYYEGNQRLDIRDLDYLAILNLLRPETEEDLDTIRRWGMASTFQDDTLLSQSDRYQIITQFLNNVTITGYSQRFNINVGFNEALVQALMKCKLSLNPTSSGRDQAERFRTSYGNIDSILNRPGSQGLYRNSSRRSSYGDDRYGDDRRRFSNRF